MLSWEESPAAAGAQPAADETPRPRSYQDILQTVYEQGDAWSEAAKPATAAAAAQPTDESTSNAAAPPSSATPAAPPVSVEQKSGTVPSPADVTRRTVESRRLSPDEEQHVDRLWSGNVGGATLNTTVKGSLTPMAPPSDLVIRCRRVQRGDQSWGDADYVLLDVIGEGGVGVVYAARQRSIDRTVALKKLRGSEADHAQEDKFLAEAVVTGELDHPNIVPVYDLARDEDGRTFYSMKRVFGTPWSELIARKDQTENLEILMKVADAVAFAHARGVVHRDLKPENVMLGDFGEVLVMDWGIALPTKVFSKSQSIGRSTGMGGTPAYMAPEMATGPLESIGPASDVYLLGAILYEIVTGRPPHTGIDVMDCVRAAARNEILPDEGGGELLDIAYQAMSTRPADRYASVQDFQAALRQYQSHSESIALMHRAEESLAHGRERRDYQHYARAVFAYQEAIALWPANEEAHRGLSAAQAEYASQALAGGDYDLGLSLLDAGDPSHAEIRRRLEAAQQERDARQHRLRAARRAMIGLVALIFVIVLGSLYEINERRNVAVGLQKLADQRANDLHKQYMELQGAKKTIEGQIEELNDAHDQIVAEKDNAVAEKTRADQAKRAALDAREEEERVAYVAQIGLADEKIAGNAFGVALPLLASYAPPLASSEKAALRHWEWGRLLYLCGRDEATLPADDRLEAVVISRDGQRIIAGGQSGKVRIWNAESLPDGVAVDDGGVLDHGGAVHALAISRDGGWLATAGEQGVKVWRLGDEPAAQPERRLTAHQGAVLSVTFSRDGERLLTASADFTARLTEWRSGREVEDFRGHHDPVHCAAFSQDESRVATAGDDRTVMIWKVGSDDPPQRFFGHQGPVYTVAFSPPDADGVERVASAGYDQQILLWSPSDLRPFDFAVLDVLARDEPLPARSDILPVPEVRTLAGHTAAVRDLQFSPDGRMLFSAGHDNAVRVWDLEADPASRRAVRSLRGHGGWVRSCDVWPEGELVVSGGYDGQVKVWDLKTYEENRVLEAHDAVLAAAFSPGGESIVTAGQDRVAKVWPLEGGDPATLQEGPEFLALGAVFFDGGRMLAASSGDNAVRKWSRASGGQIPFENGAALRGTGRRGALAATPDDRFLVTGSDDLTVKIWDAQTGELHESLAGPLGEVSALAVSPDDRFLAAGDVRGLVILWRRDDDRWSELHRLKGHTPGHAITAIRFLPGGHLLTASEDNSVGRWDAGSGEELRELTLKHSDAVKSLHVSRDGRRALTLAADGVARLWDVAAAQAVELNGSDEPARAAALSPDGTEAIVALSEPRFRRYRLGDGDARIAVNRPAAAEPWMPQNSPGEVWSMEFSPEGDELLTVGGNHARLWDYGVGRKSRTFSPNGVLTAASYSAAGDRIATASLDGTVKIWDPAAARVVRQITDAHGGLAVHSVAFSPVAGEARLLTGGSDAAARLWSADDGQLLATLQQHRGVVRGVAFSSDARRAVTVGDDGAAYLWRLDSAGSAPEPAALPIEASQQRSLLCAAFAPETADPEFRSAVILGGEDNLARIWRPEGEWMELAGHTAPVRSVAFSPDGRRALTASEDNTAKVWNTQTGKELLTLRGHMQPLTTVSFSPDGRWVLTASRDATSLLWPSAPWRQTE